MTPARPHVRMVLSLALTRIFINMTRRFAYPFLPEISRSLDTSLANVQTAIAVQSGTGVISPLIGSYTERYGHKRMMLASLLIIVVACAVGAFAPGTYGVFFLVIMALGVAKWAFDPAMQAYISDRIPYQRRGLALGVTELSWALSLLVVAPIGGYLLGQSAGLSGVFLMLMFANIVGFVLVLRYVSADHPDGATAATKFSIGGIFRLLSSSPLAVAALGFSFLLYASNEMIFIVYGAWLEDTYNLELASLGILTVVISAGEIIGELIVIAFADTFGKRRLILLGGAISSTGYLLMPQFDNSLPLFLGVLFIVFVAVEVAIVSSIPLISEVMPTARASMMSANVAAQSLGRFAGAFLGGAFFAAGGFGVVGAIAFLVGGASFGLMWRLIQEQA